MRFTPAYFVLLSNIFLLGSLIASTQKIRKICAVLSGVWFFIGLFVAYKTITQLYSIT